MMTLYRTLQVVPAASKLISSKLMPRKMFDDIAPFGSSWYPKTSKTQIEIGVEMEEHIHQLLGTRRSNMTIININDNLVNFVFTNSIILSECKADVELQVVKGNNILQGHPDLISSTVIFDVKCTGRFSTMKKACIHQLLIYYCLAKLMNLAQTSVGLILPFQNIISCVDLSVWDWRTYWDEICILLNKMTTCYPGVNQFYMTYGMAVGNHISLKDVPMCVDQPAIQFFISSNRCPTIKMTDVAKEKLKQHVGRMNYAAVHAPYTLNLVQKYDDNWVATSLAKQIKFASDIGVKHIVIHVGILSAQLKKGGMTEAVAIERMRENLICAIMESNGSNCKILLETPAGETGELLNTAHDFCEFVESMNGVVGICVDTCHVFSAGHDPIKYISEIEQRNLSVDLVHFNDSQTKLGGCCDRHARVGFGEIGISKMSCVARHCIERKIPMVQE